MKFNLLLISMMAGVLSAFGADRIDNGKWTLVHDGNRLDISYGGKQVFPDVRSSVTYNLVGDTNDHLILSHTATALPPVTEPVNDEFGEGTSYVCAFTDGTAILTRRINIYDSYPYLIVSATVEASDKSIVESRHIVPFSLGTSAYPLEGTTTQRTLFVPFDNDSHTIRYQSDKFGAGEMTSSEVSALFDPTSRRGIVIGSVDHDKWKSGIALDTKNGGRVAKLECLSGWTDYLLTKDALPHGKVKGSTVSSARYMVGVFDDWREGLNTFAAANNLVAPRPEWKKGNPIGWNSWGAQCEHINYDGVYDSATFLYENLKEHGFHDNDGQITISLDSFNGALGDANLYKLGTKVFSDGPYRDGREMKQGMNMVLGMYGGMVVWDWTLGSKINGTGLNGTRDYTWGEVTLKVNGENYGFQGSSALAIDPTHPAVRANLEYEFAKWSRFGAKYVKMDFVNSAIHEGDSWYDPEVTTGVMAYNYGMKIVRELAEKYDMYVVLAMSPLFPYQYAHGRRTCCDRWGRLEESEFVMNAISYGWWTSGLYTVNDPDQMTLCQNGHNMSETMGENRVRATSGMTTGAYIFGDNFSDNCFYTDDNGHKKGDVVAYPAESRRRALEILGNEDINDYVRNNVGSFMPVEGGNPSRKQDAEVLYMRHTPQYLYLAVFNWSQLIPSSGTVKFERLGIEPTNVGAIKELWFGDELMPAEDGIKYSVPPGDVRIYRISKLDYVPGDDGIEDVVDDRGRDVAVKITSFGCDVSASEEIKSVDVYNMAAVRVAGEEVVGKTAVRIPLTVIPGIYFVRCVMADGSIRTAKVVASR